MSLSTLSENGHIEVGQGRDNPLIKIYYELHGNGPEKVCLIMGLNSSCFSWELQTKYLAETNKYTVLIFDNRGMGLSDSPKGMYTTSQMAQDVIDMLDHLGWKNRVHLNGISMGGMIALELVSTWPDRFASLILTSTTSGRQIPPLKAITTLTKNIFVRDPKLKLGSFIEIVYPPEWLSSKPTVEDDPDEKFETNRDMVISTALARIERTKPQTINGNLGQMAACLRHYVSDERLLKIKNSGIPVLVITGTWDNLVNPKNSYHISKVLECPLEVFDSSGHGIPGERPSRYNKLLDEHFSKAFKTSSTEN
ncbi:Alpha/Beta hydrolase protein [Mycotypha africana]|uniref:Alpha/Beta hydrolase protein n=1 Tax=Mycotypha africana TaxID=64632 RepID=UPI0023012D16|nr:Alpha/Beta hydrolase protein [Mycotypha africana]KAI8971755.1 Alpha/Beta hydrolase protein [Mycotypha africana]